MVKVLKHGQTVQNMKVIMYMEKSMVMGDLHGQMAVLTLVNLKRTIFKVKVHTIGLMVVSLLEPG